MNQHPGWGPHQPPGPQHPGYSQHPGYPQHGYPPPPPKPGVSVIRIIAVVLLLPIVLASFYFFYIVVFPHPASGPKAARSGPAKYLDDPAAAIRSPQVITNEDLVVPSGGAQSLSFSLPSERPVRLTIEGKRDTAKGFNVYLMKDSDWDSFKAKREFSYFPALSNLKTGGFEKTATLPAGHWNIAVHNSENLLKGMTVHIKVVADPE